MAFYDGDPNASGELIGFQHLPHLDPNETHDFRVVFQPDACGKHEIFVVAGEDTRHEHTAKLLQPIVVAGRECKQRGDHHGKPKPGHGHRHDDHGRAHAKDRR